MAAAACAIVSLGAETTLMESMGVCWPSSTRARTICEVGARNGLRSLKSSLFALDWDLGTACRCKGQESERKRNEIVYTSVWARNASLES